LPGRPCGQRSVPGRVRSEARVGDFDHQRSTCVPVNSVGPSKKVRACCSGRVCCRPRRRRFRLSMASHRGQTGPCGCVRLQLGQWRRRRFWPPAMNFFPGEPFRSQYECARVVFGASVLPAETQQFSLVDGVSSRSDSSMPMSEVAAWSTAPSSAARCTLGEVRHTCAR